MLFITPEDAQAEVLGTSEDTWLPLLVVSALLTKARFAGLPVVALQSHSSL